MITLILANFLGPLRIGEVEPLSDAEWAKTPGGEISGRSNPSAMRKGQGGHPWWPPCPFEGNFAPCAQSCTGAVPLAHGKVCPLAGKFRLFSGLRALDAPSCAFALDTKF